jgi:hypothetical protein
MGLQTFQRAVVALALLAASRPIGAAAIDWDPEHTFVFAVGILEWQHADIWSPFPDAVPNRRDAQLVRYFKDAGVPDEQIVYLQDAKAKKAAVQRAFVELLDETDDGDLLVVYFAGHGYRNVDTDQTWFAVYDAGKRDASGWSVPSIFMAIDEHFSGNRCLLMADCCHSGALYDEVERRRGGDVGFAALTSAYSHNTSTGDWTFTDSLLQALRGRPHIDHDRDGQIELNEAARYIDGEMAFVEGQKSMFIAGSGFAADTKLVPVAGTAKPKAGLHCEAWSDGKWYKAVVREFDTASGQYYVHYLGYDAKYDEWTAGENVRTYEPRQFPVGAKVQAYSGDEEAWYPATVRQSWYGLHLVHYDDYDATYDEWLGPAYVKPR